MKKLMVKNGSYTTNDGQEKSRWVQVGVIMENANGEFAILEPHVNLAGLPRSDRGGVMVSIFTDQPQGNQSGNLPKDEDLPF